MTVGKKTERGKKYT